MSHFLCPVRFFFFFFLSFSLHRASPFPPFSHFLTLLASFCSGHVEKSWKRTGKEWERLFRWKLASHSLGLKGTLSGLVSFFQGHSKLPLGLWFFDLSRCNSFPSLGIFHQPSSFLLECFHPSIGTQCDNVIYNKKYMFGLWPHFGDRLLKPLEFHKW